MTHKPGPHEWGLSRKAIMTACEGSLRRLKTDVIDLYQVHMQDRNVAIDETLRALDDFVTEGEGSVHRLRQLRGVQPRRVALGRG